MEKAIEIKRRAQRCVQNGDVDGALREYEKLVDSPDADPYNYVLLADLLHKKGDQHRAGERYLNAVTAYELAGLFKNGIAVCKKMMRLSLSQGEVLRHLAELHAKDGLTSEAAVYFSQYAEYALRANKANDAIAALRKAFDHAPENVKLLERLSEVLLLEGETQRAAETMREAAEHWRTRGQQSDVARCLARANVILPGSVDAAAIPEPPLVATSGMMTFPPPASGYAPPVLSTPTAPVAPLAPTGPPAEVGILTGSRIPETAPSLYPQAPPANAMPAAPAPPELDPAVTPGQPSQPETPAFGPPSTAPPRMDSSVFERAPQFVSPANGPATAPQAPPAPPAPNVSLGSSSENHHEPVTPPEGVYDLGSGADLTYEAALSAAKDAPPPPPVSFEPPAPESEPTPSLIARRPEELLGSVANVEELLQRAQAEFRAGHRDRASQALVEAALAYERLDRLDSAATIFRSLGRGAQAPIGVMELWLANCEKRSDHVEGSQVACELGDRALNDGHDSDAKRWFERSLSLHANNDTARRRLQRLANTAASQTAPGPQAGPESPGNEMGRVAVAVGRGQAVTFDLGSLLQEFQRGVATQLEGDAQGHYDLGMAYREMGLHEEAVGSFRISEVDPRLAVRSQEMIGRCLADLGRHDEAVREFERALRSPILDAAGEAELRFQLALTFAALGDMPDALAQVEIADMRFPGRLDIAERLAEWRRSFGQAA